MSYVRPLALAALVSLSAAPAPASTVYWCPTEGGAAWLRLEIEGLAVRSIRRVPLRILTLDEGASEPVVPPTGTEAAQALRPPTCYGSRTAECYHVSPACTAGRQIRDGNRLEFDDDASAKEAGRVRCQTCGGRHPGEVHAEVAVSDDGR